MPQPAFIFGVHAFYIAWYQSPLNIYGFKTLATAEKLAFNLFNCKKLFNSDLRKVTLFY